MSKTNIILVQMSLFVVKFKRLFRRWGEKMAKEVWEKLKEAEAEAGKLIEDAKLQSVTIIKKAREEVAQIIKDAEAKAIREGEATLGEAIKRAQAYKGERIRELQNQQQSLSKLGESRITGAVNLILEKVVR